MLKRKTLPLLLSGLLIAAGFLAGCANTKKPREEVKVTDPVCGMQVTVSDKTLSYSYQGKTYYFCSEDCRNAFLNDPSGYVMKEAKAIDPVCGMEVNQTGALSYEYGRTNYYFDSEACKAKFVSDPEKYLHGMHEEMGSHPESMHGN